MVSADTGSGNRIKPARVERPSGAAVSGSAGVIAVPGRPRIQGDQRRPAEAFHKLVQRLFGTFAAFGPIGFSVCVVDLGCSLHRLMSQLHRSRHRAQTVLETVAAFPHHGDRNARGRSARNSCVSRQEAGPIGSILSMR
jgi:hypothetical protein